MKTVFLTLIAITLGGCAFNGPTKFDTTYAEEQAGYSYIPVEPSSVSILCPNSQSCTSISKRSLLDALPDNSVRIATRLLSTKADVGLPVFGADVGYEGNSYEVIIDFVNTQTVNKQFIGKWHVTVPDQVTVRPNRCYPFERSVLGVISPDRYENWSLRAKIRPTASDNYQAEAIAFDTQEQSRSELQSITLICGKDRSNRSGETVPYESIKITSEPFNIPVYVGIGLRLKANVTVLKGSVNLSSLPALTAAVSAGDATGTMSVQTIGISGKAARSNLLLLDKIDATTIQNAIQVLSSIKASIESSDTTITPRIVGFHNTIGAGAQGVNLIHSLLASDNSIAVHLDPSGYATGAVSDSSTTN